jgi:hypothetical protein
MCSNAPARVPLLSYRSNLDAFIAKVQALGAKPIVVALPSGLADGDFPEYLIASGFTRSATEAIADHRAYADTARQAALHSLVDFVDLQPSFEGPDGVVPGLFRADKIHMTDAGNARIAGTLRDYPHRTMKTSRWTVVGLAGCALLLIARCLHYRGSLIDDAYIVFRYADNLLAGLGPVFNAGERVEGFTSPLWLLLLAGAKAAGLSYETSVFVFGTAFRRGGR